MDGSGVVEKVVMKVKDSTYTGEMGNSVGLTFDDIHLLIRMYECNGK